MLARTERATAAVWDAARAIDEGVKGLKSRTPQRNSRPPWRRRWPRPPPELYPGLHPGARGIGFTWEHDTNVYYRRALGWSPRSAAPPTIRSASSTPPPPPACASSISTLDPETEKLREEIRAEIESAPRRFRPISAQQRSLRVAG